MKQFVIDKLSSSRVELNIFYQVWNREHKDCLKTLTGHTGPVWGLAISEDFLVSASQDSTVSINENGSGRRLI